MTRKGAFLLTVVLLLSVGANIAQFVHHHSTPSVTREGAVKVSLMDRASITLDLFKLKDAEYQIVNNGLGTEHLLACGLVGQPAGSHDATMDIQVENLGEGQIKVAMLP